MKKTKIVFEDGRMLTVGVFTKRNVQIIAASSIISGIIGAAIGFGISLIETKAYTMGALDVKDEFEL